MRDLIFIDQDLNRLKADCSDSKSAVYKRLIDHCESYFGQALDAVHPPSSTTFMGIAMANLSLAFILSEDRKYLEEAKRWLFTCVGYPHWGNAHLVDVDLSAAWILFGMGLTYDWIKDELNNEEVRIVKEKILLQGGRMYDFKVRTEGSGWSTNYWQNHNWINMTGLAASGYALISEEPAVQDWIDSAKENFEVVYSVMPDDGSDYEGVVYWRYGAMWLFIYAHLLKEREGIDYFRNCDFLKNTFYYRLYQSAPNLEEQINFGDAHDRRSGHSTAIYYKTAAEYRNGHAQKLGNLVRDELLESEAQSKVKPGILPECFFEMLFYDDSVKEEEFSTLPAVRFFDDLGLFVHRSSWERDATSISFKCSRPGGKKQWDLLWKFKDEKDFNCFGLSHQHPDNNSFLLHTGGEFIAIDDGYNRTVKASDHNVVLVDGKGYEDEGQNNIWKNYSRDMTAEIEECVIEDNFSYVRGESAKVYQKSLKLNSFKRHFINSGKSWFFVADELDSDLAHTYTWQMYSDLFPEVRNDQFFYSLNNARLSLYSFSDKEVSYDMKENTVRAVMTTQEPDKFTENHMKGLCISNTVKTERMSFLTVLIPGESEGGKIIVKKIELDGAYGVQLSHKDNSSSEILFYSTGSSFSYAGKTYESKLTLIETEKEIVKDVRKIC
ncbi:MAG: DUF4962 domain-containing protein [Spirochaetales bacterium]|nr:DUF4962 domain-containing protein [Spirochaetales bacterium]